MEDVERYSLLDRVFLEYFQASNQRYFWKMKRIILGLGLHLQDLCKYLIKAELSGDWLKLSFRLSSYELKNGYLL